MSTKQNQDPDGVTVKVLVSTVDRPERIYANHVQVRFSPLDVTLEFCEFDGVSDRELKRKGDEAEITIPAKVRIALTHEVFGKLSAVMAGIVQRHDIKVEPIEVAEDEHKS